MKSIAKDAAVKVVIVEDHPEFRDHLTHALQAAGRFELVGMCNDLPAGLSLVEMSRPDVLLVDLGLPSGSGIALVRMAQRLWGARCNSAILTVTGNEDHLMTSVGAGAKGYLFKSDQPKQWLEVIDGLSDGVSPLHAKVAQRFLKKIGDRESDEESATRDLLMHIASGYTVAETARQLKMSDKAAGTAIRRVYDRFQIPVPDLSKRELELMTLLDKGFAFRMCAELMGVSESTTKTHAARAYQKLGANNLQMALYEARMAGLLT